MHQNVKSREYISVKYWGTCIFIETLMFSLKMIAFIKKTMLISHIFADFFSKIFKKNKKILFFRNMLCWNLFINNKIEFEYDSRVKNISKHTSKLVWTCSIQVQSTKYISAVHWELVCLDETLMFYLKIFENSHIYTVFSKILKKINFLLKY